MAALWRGATSRSANFPGARHARRAQRCASAGGNVSSGVVRSVGRTFARLGRHSLGAQAIHPPRELDLRREPVRDQRGDRISRAGGQRVGRGIPGLRLQLEQMSRGLRALHANRFARHQRGGMRSGARRRTRGLGLRLRSARQLGRQAALLSRPRPIPGDVPRRAFGAHLEFVEAGGARVIGEDSRWAKAQQPPAAKKAPMPEPSPTILFHEEIEYRGNSAACLR
jgi:hypothetical protein